jgi:hypothetical protein
LPLPASTSANTGVAPHCKMTMLVGSAVIAVVITSSPGCTPDISRATCKAPVPLLMPSATGKPNVSAKRRSNS